MRGDGWLQSGTGVYRAGGDFLNGVASDRQTIDARLLQLWGSVVTQTVEEKLVP
jgi:hypothetical protein